MSTQQSNDYWAGRQDILYYQVARILATRLSEGAQSIIDVGPAGCPYLDWFPHVPKRTSLDLKRPYEAPGVESVKANFFDWTPDRTFDVVICLQVLEHVPDARAFARKLLATGKVVIVSVPFQWEKGKTKSHIHDPVDKKKMRDWFGRPPNFEYICRELVAPVDRLIQVYDAFDQPWRGLNRRERIIQSLPDTPDGERPYIHPLKLRLLRSKTLQFLRARAGRYYRALRARFASR